MKMLAYTVNDNGDDELCCTITFDGKSVTFDGLPGVIEILSDVYIKDRQYSPKDGEAYMKLLPMAFCGSRFFVVPAKD